MGGFFDFFLKEMNLGLLHSQDGCAPFGGGFVFDRTALIPLGGPAAQLTSDLRLSTSDSIPALPPLVACRFFQQNLSWCFG
jgi:hypothetical protein